MDELLYYSQLDYESDNYLILKGRIKAVETNTYGLFIIFFNENQKLVEKLIVIASHYSALFDIDPKLPWYTIEENLVNLKWKGDIAVNISIDLQNYMESALDQDRGNELYFHIKNNDTTKIETLLQAILMKPLADRNIIIDTHFELVSRENMSAIRAERDKPKIEKTPPPASADFKIKGADLIDVNLILAPVSGIPIHELGIGDKIMVKIESKSTIGNYYIDAFGARVDGNIIPVAAEVVEIKRGEEKEYIILCKLGENVYGKVIETEPVKLKKYDELLVSHSTPEDLPGTAKPHKVRSFTLFIIITGGLIFILLLLFLILWLNNYL